MEEWFPLARRAIGNQGDVRIEQNLEAARAAGDRVRERKGLLVRTKRSGQMEGGVNKKKKKEKNEEHCDEEHQHHDDDEE